MKKYEKISDKYFKLKNQLREECIKYLFKQLNYKKHNGTIIFTRPDIDYSLSVVYDGGSHPEYASNAFSFIESIYIEDNKIYLSIDDCSAWSIDNCSTDELYDICSFIDEYKL